MDADRLIDAFRGAALGTSSWLAAAQAMADATGARAGQIAGIQDEAGLVFNVVAGVDDDGLAAYAQAGGGDPRINPRTRAALHATPLRCVIDDDYVTRQMRERLPIFTGFFRDYEVQDSIILPLGRSSGVQMAAALLFTHRGDAQQRQRRLMDAVAPALAETIANSVRLGTATQATLMTTAEQLSGAAILLGAGGTILSLSPAAEAVLRSGAPLSVREGRLVARGAGADIFDRAITRALGDDACGVVTTLLHGDPALPPLSLNLCRLPQSVSGPLALGRLLLTIQSPRGTVSATLLRDTYGLTRSESEVALLVANGLTVAQIAGQRNTAPATVRSQLKTLFEKTGTHRQAELALLVQRLR